eukprot:1968246-Rhodomonas_salina.1
MESFECEGLISAYQIALEGMPGQGDSVDGVPTPAQRRNGNKRPVAKKAQKQSGMVERKAGEP